MTNEQQSMPHFDNPPIVEKLMGIEFAPLEQWAVPHFGLFWQEIRASYPRFQVQPEITDFSEDSSYVDLNSIRCWFFHESQERLLQIQNGRFIYNLQEPAAYEKYPRYETIRQEFIDEWLRFCKFLESNDIGSPSVQQCEITYIDHFVRGREWQDLSDLPDIINCWSGIPSKFLPSEPDFVAIQTAYSMPDEKGRLVIRLQPVVRTEDEKEILQLTITAVGEPLSSDIEDMLVWFNLGREFAVRSFIDLTSEKMHELWGRRDGV